MSTKHEIAFTIKPDGTVEFTVNGVKGTRCLSIAELFKVLGEIESERATAEYYETEEQEGTQITTQS